MTTEVNLLPIGVANTRPNYDVSSYGNVDVRFSNCYFETYPSSQVESQKVYCIKRPGINVSAAASPGYAQVLGLGAFAAQPYGETSIWFAGRAGSGVCSVWHWDGSSVNGFIDTSTPSVSTWSGPPAYWRVNFVNIGLPDDKYNVGFTSYHQLILLKKNMAAASTVGLATTVVPFGNGCSQWTSGHAYTVGDGSSGFVWYGNYLYKCLENHTSGAIMAVDEANGKWMKIDLTRPVYLNNRVFVGSRGTGQITQSNLGDWWSAWPTTEYLTAEAYGGRLTELVRYNNFIVAFKEYSIEFFEDVANQNGTVLGRVNQAAQKVGCTHPNTIVDTGQGNLMFVSTDESGNHAVMLLKDNFSCTEVDDPMVAKYLNLIHSYDGCYAYLVNVNGHQFYVLNLKAAYDDTSDANDIYNATFVYDIDKKLWTHWYSEGHDNSVTINAITYQPPGRWIQAASVRDVYNTTYVQDHGNGALYQLDDYYVSDGVQNITYKVRLTGIDMGTYKRKFINRISLYLENHGYVLNPYITAKMMRDDGNLTSSRTMTQQPYVSWGWGSARRFGLELTCTTACPIRLSAINVDFDVGEGNAIS